jgi:hypothetical protein
MCHRYTNPLQRHYRAGEDKALQSGFLAICATSMLQVVMYGKQKHI